MPSRKTADTRRPISARKSANRNRLTAEDVGFFFQSIVSARDQLSEVTKSIAKESSLGPRGPWILGIIGSGTISPEKLADFFYVGRSLISIELARLTDAGLVKYQKGSEDRRRVELSLTSSGLQIQARLSDALTKLLSRRLKGYSRKQILQCASLLSDFSQEV